MTRYFMRILALLFLAIGAESMAMAAATVAIPSGTSVEVRITEQLSSETANVGQVFHGVLALPVVIRGKVLFPKGAQVTGEVLNVERSGRLSSPGELHLSLRTIRSGGRSYPVAVRPIVIKGESHTKSNITKIGGGTAVGALIGAIAGGGKARPSAQEWVRQLEQEWQRELARNQRSWKPRQCWFGKPRILRSTCHRQTEFRDNLRAMAMFPSVGL